MDENTLASVMPTMRLGSSQPRLPSEIWGLVIEKFAEGLPDDIDWSSSDSPEPNGGLWTLSTIQNLRLVSRMFNYFASPLLCPFLRLEISYESMNCAKGLLKNLRIASGIREIQLSLAYRPEYFVCSRPSYGSHWAMKVERADRALGYELKSKTKPENEESDPELWLKFAASEEQQAFLEELRYIALQGAARTRSYFEVIRWSYEHYKKAHFEQFALLMDGSFVRQLAAAISLFRRPIALHLTDEVWGSSRLWEPGNHHLFLEKKEIGEALVQPQTWSDIRSGLLPARVLTELPIAIYEAGGRLRSLRINCALGIDNCHSIFPLGISPRLVCERLRDASKYIESFQFGHGEYFCPYVSAVLSSKRLRHLSVLRKMGRYRYEYPNGSSCKPAACIPINTRPSIQKLRINYARLSQWEMEGICRMLSPQCEDLFLQRVELYTGSWSDILDILREIAGPRVANGLCKMYIGRLVGGGFPRRPEPHGYDQKMNQVADYIKGQHVDKWWGS